MPQPEGHLPQVVKKKEGHMPELRKRRSHLALLGVFAMAASVLAVGAPSAMAEAGRPEATATYSACVGPATRDAGFTDVATGSTHDAAVNCIAYYGITKGTTATTFAPSQTISRWQLAVMLQRAAGPAGVDLPEASNRGYTDISGMSSAFQDAINQMGELGIMTGTTATTFDPSGIVSRAVIVEALAGFLANARVGPGGRALSRDINGNITLKDSASVSATTIAVDETFRDIGGVTYAANQAIRALAEMGVVQGRGDGTFGPAASVTRAQAAAFITRALAHTNTRPAGLTMQSSADVGGVTTATTAIPRGGSFDLSISLRGDDFAPVDSAAVDVFYHAARDAASAFKTDGTCNSGANGVQSAGVGACAIELDDDVTEPDGNTMAAPGTLTADTVYWAWTGDTGDTLDRDVVEDSKITSVALTTVTSADRAKVTTSVSRDAEGGNTVRYGTSVTVTIQLVDANGNNIGIADQTYTWDAQGVHAAAADGRLSSIGTRTVTTDSSGKATFTLSQADPNTATSGARAAGNNNMTTWTYNIAKMGTTVVDLEADMAIGFSVTGGGTTGPSGSGSVIFDDDPPRALKVGVELQRTWTRRPDQGATARVGVTGKVTDQYGNPQRGVDIFFDLNADPRFGCAAGPPIDCTTANTGITGAGTAAASIPGTTKRTTRSNGTNTVSASWANAAPTTFAPYRVGADLNNDNDVGDPGETAMANHLWTLGPAGFNAETGSAVATTPPSGVTGTGHGGLVGVDLDTNALIHISAWNGAGGARDGTFVHRDYRYTDDTLFKWFVGGLQADIDANRDAYAVDSNGAPLVRWLNTEQFEARMAKHIKRLGPGTTGAGNYGGQFGVLSYNTKSGSTILSIRIDGNQNADAAARATANEALIQDPSTG